MSTGAWVIWPKGQLQDLPAGAFETGAWASKVVVADETGVWASKVVVVVADETV